MCRVASTEHPELQIAHIDANEDTDASSLDYDMMVSDAYDETAWRKNRRYVAVLKHSPLHPAERRHRTVRFGHDNFAVAIREPRNLDTVEYQSISRTPPGRGEAEVRTLAVSLNFADVLTAMDAVQPYDGGLPPLGVELAGEISAVGQDVTAWTAGDRVLALPCPGIGAWQAFAPSPPRTFIACPMV